MDKMKNKRLFLLDMDGTLYLDDRLFPGAAEFLAKIQKSGGKYLFLTNNSSKGVDAYVEKMIRLGVPAAAEDFLTSIDALIVFLERTYGAAVKKKKMYVVGTRSFRAQLAAAGFLLTETPDDDTEILILGFDRELTYSKLEDACRLLMRGVQEPRTFGDAKAAAGLPAVDYYATNPDWVCPTAFGSVPDCGSPCREYIQISVEEEPRIKRWNKGTMVTGERMPFAKLLREAYREFQENMFDSLEH